jgi:hypothetical protein
MQNLTTLFNAAFAALGDEVLISDALTDTSRKAVIARTRWPSISDAMLRSHPWNCAIKRKTLAPDQTPPDYGYQNYFTWPTDPYCLRILQLQTRGLPFDIEGRKIAADSTELGMKYIGRIPVDEFDSMLFEVSVDILAAELALPLPGQADFRKTLLDGVYAAGGKLSWARGIDGQEGSTKTSANRPLIDVRGGRGASAGNIEWMNR